jgi:histidyl-tRNA synthetase
MKKEIIKFLEENKVDLYNKLIEIEEIEECEVELDDLMFEVGCYEKGNTLIDSEDICMLLEGFDVSFDKKLVRLVDRYEGRMFEFDFKDEKIFGLKYNV